MCEYGFLAARARSTENAAIAKSSTPPRGGKTGHSCKAQQDKSVELTDCGLSEPSPQVRQWPLLVGFLLINPRPECHGKGTLATTDASLQQGSGHGDFCRSCTTSRVGL
jgi:hypothetical protein